MAGPVIVVDGFAPTNKVPGFKGATIFASGRSSASLYQRVVLLVGLMGAGSTATAGTIYDIYKDSDLDKFGARSELGRMGRIALRYAGAKIKAVAPTAAGGAAAATATITIGGTWTAAWTFRYYVAGELVTGTIAASASTSDAATTIRDAFLAKANLPVSAGASGAVVTLTVDSAGVRGNQYILAQDTTEMPSTATSALAGGTATTGGMVPFTGGSGVETYTSLIATVATAQYDRIALAANDATSLGAWKTHLRSQAASTIGNLESVVFALNGLLAAAQSMSQTTLNEPRMNNLWMLNSETHPSEVAASFATRRAVTEEANPSPRYMNVELLGVAPHRYLDDYPIESVRDSALNAGVTPIMTTADGLAVVNRGITTYCKLGSAQDDRTLDINQQSMPDYARERLKSIWDQEIAPNYERVRDDPGDNDPDPPAGVIYPKLWNATIYGEEKVWEDNGWVVDVDDNLPVSVYDSTGRRLMSEVAVVPTPLNYQVGVNVRQRSS